MGVDRALAVIGIISTLILLVLDKAGKLKGAALLWMLLIAAFMTVPLAIKVPWMNAAPSVYNLIARRLLMASLVIFLYALIAFWVTNGPNDEKALDDNRKIRLSLTEVLPEVQDRGPTDRLLIKSIPKNPKTIAEAPLATSQKRSAIAKPKENTRSGMFVNNGGIVNNGPGTIEHAEINNNYGPPPPVPLNLTYRQATAIKEAVSQFPNEHISIKYEFGSESTSLFAARLKQTLEDGGAVVQIEPSVILMVAPPSVIHPKPGLSFGSAGGDEIFIAAIAQCLSRNGFPVPKQGFEVYPWPAGSTGFSGTSIILGSSQVAPEAAR